ncbi:MAG: DUF1573 domain-containing protein [Brumimicrobium sp.]|nr:DUF1573 domain-containing protein [Brumimicrobium sp.]
MKKIGFIISIALVTFACNNGGAVDSNITVKDGQVKSKLSSGDTSAEELKAAAKERQKQREVEEKERLSNLTTMEVYPTIYDFGNIAKETPVTTTFKIKNTGDKPLIVNDAQASCGCTVPKKPTDPILPGEESDLEVTFTSNPSQAGTAINKTITVTANIPGSVQTVTIKGQVAP